MIWMTADKPITYAFVNTVQTRENNGVTYTTYGIATSSKKQDGTYENSTWWASLMGEARKKNDMRPLVKGDKIAITSLKLTNVAKKQPDGSWGKPFLNVAIGNYDLQGANGSSGFIEGGEEEMPF